MNKLERSDPENTTIFDVAERAGVSIKTVSRVANGQPNVREVTRSRVQRVIKELDYRPNPYAQSLASRPRKAVTEKSAAR